MPVYFEPRKRKNRPILSARTLRFGAVLVSAWALLTVLAFLQPTTPAVTPEQAALPPAIQPFARGTFGIVLESNSGSASLADEFMSRLANELSAEHLDNVIQVNAWINTPTEAKAVGTQYNAGLTLWLRDQGNLSTLVFTLNNPGATTAGNVPALGAVMTPQNYEIPVSLNVDIAQLAAYIQGVQQYHSGQYILAGNTFQRLLNDQATEFKWNTGTVPNAILFLYHGNAMFQQGNCPAALRDYAQVSPGSVYVAFNQGSTYYQQGDVLRAWQMFDLAAWYGDEFTSEQLAIAQYSRGRAAEQMGLQDQARDAYKAAMMLRPAYFIAHRLDELNIRLATQRSALPTPDVSYSGDAAVLYDRAAQYIDRRDFNSALEVMSEAIRAMPDANVLYNTRGYLYTHLDQPDLAIQDFNTSIALNGDQAYAYMGRGYVYAAMGDMREANRNFERAITNVPDYAGTYIAWGLAYQLQGDTLHAGEKFWQWMQHNSTSSTHARFVNNQATIQMTQGKIVYLTVTMRAGQTLSVLAAAENPFALDPTLVILDPQGNPVAGNDDRMVNKDYNAQIVGLYMPVDGTYTIAVSHAGGGSEGQATVTYSLQ